jgi:glycosyltransferase involved in cell wall biosynthesis
VTPLRVGLDLVYLVEDSGGSGTYARELVPALLEAEPDVRITAFVARSLPPDVRSLPWAGEVEWVTLPVSFDYGRPWNPLLVLGAEWGAIAAAAARRRLHVVHGLANVTPVLQPRAATVVTLHDLIWLSYPGTMSRRATLSRRLVAIPSARRADRVIAVSAAARADISARLGIEPGRIDVVHHGLGASPGATPTPEAQLRERLGLGDRRVVLHVGQKREHKNLTGLIRALADLGRSDVVAVLAGAESPHESELRALASQLGVEAGVRFPGWTSDADLEGLYALASCVVLPSFEEGFGFPVLEAMRRGVPVACADASSLPEVAGDAALLFDPRDPADIARQIGRLLDEPQLRSDLVRRGHDRVTSFTWEKAARGTLATYRRAVEGRRR